MEERRKVQRHRTFKAGSSAFKRTGAIVCRVRNLSPAGACLEVASQIGIPDQFVLQVDVDRLRQPPRNLAHRDSHEHGIRRQDGLKPSKGAGRLRRVPHRAGVLQAIDSSTNSLRR